jgi:hypothetical protein
VLRFVPFRNLNPSETGFAADIKPASMKFNLDRIVITPAALEIIPADDICNAINCHG